MESRYDTPKRRVTLLSVVTTIVALYRTIMVIFMFVVSAIHSNRYTYWNYVGQTVFYDLLWFAYMMNNTYLLKCLTIFVLPIVTGSVLFVFAYIIVILQLDGGELFVAATYLDGGAFSVGTVHTMDHLVHVFPLVDLFLVYTSGFIKEARIITIAFYEALKKNGYVHIFTFYYFISPLLPFALYCCFFNPFVEYPTEVSNIVPLSIGLAIFLFIVWWTYAVLTTRTYGHFRTKELLA